MFSMRNSLVFGVALAIASLDAHAWFFFFIPGSVIDKVGDKLSGAEGENCVAATAKLGDRITSPAGNVATIRSLSGQWSRCTNPKLPIRARLEFEHSFTSSAGLELADSFQPKEISATSRFNGMLLNAIDPQRTIGIVVFARPRQAGADGSAIARSFSEGILGLVEDGKISDAEELTVNGMRAYRFQAVGKNKGIFGKTFTYVVTVLEGEREFVIVNANCLSGDFSQHGDYLKRAAYDVRGLTTTSVITVQPAAPAAGADSLAVGTSQQSSQVPAAENGSSSSPSGSMPERTPVPVDAIAEKLRLLDKMRKEGLISDADYEAKKQELLKSI